MTSSLPFEHARQVLNLPDEFTPTELKRAYRRAVRSSPPDRDAEGFRRVRAALDLLQSPLAANRSWLKSYRPHAPLLSPCENTTSQGHPPKIVDGLALARLELGKVLEGLRAEDLLPGREWDKLDTLAPLSTSTPEDLSLP